MHIIFGDTTVDGEFGVVLLLQSFILQAVTLPSQASKAARYVGDKQLKISRVDNYDTFNTF